MNRRHIATFLTVALIAVSANAETIIKLGLSTDNLADIELVSGELSTVDDGLGATVGEQNTEVTYLNSLLAAAGGQPFGGNNLSFTMSGVTLDGTPASIGNTVLQATAGGTFELFDHNNNLLLAATLGDGILSGPVGGTATGGFLTTEFGTFTGGSILSNLLPGLTDSSLSISLTNVNNGRGLSLSNAGEIEDFTADATANIGATIPEPSVTFLMTFGLLITAMFLRNR